jgi:D-psicose/D-tagatose/L-ribulose 3-epimerase
MQIGVSAFAWTANFNSAHLQILDEAKGLGFSAVEVPMFEPWKISVREIRAAFERADIACTVCAILPATINPISSDAEVRNRAKQHLRQCVECAAEMGAKLIGGPLYAPIGYMPEFRRTPDQWKWAVEAFQSLEPVLDACNLTLSIEPVNRSETSFLRTAADAGKLCDEIGSSQIGATIDTFHANIEEPNIPSAISQLGSYLKHMHMSENDRGPLGRGHVPFAEILETLKSVGYDGILMIEGFGYCADERNAPGWLWAPEDLSPLEFASHSLYYLQKVLTTLA